MDKLLEQHRRCTNG